MLYQSRVMRRDEIKIVPTQVYILFILPWTVNLCLGNNFKQPEHNLVLGSIGSRSFSSSTLLQKFSSFLAQQHECDERKKFK